MMLWQDIHYGLRSLSRSPGFTAVAALTLAVGIGANTAMFSLIDAVWLRPLPFSSPDRLVNLAELRNGTVTPASGHEFSGWDAERTTFDGVATFEYGSFNLTGNGEPEALRSLLVSADYFDVLGVAAARGRTFRAGEDRAGANRVAVLSTRLWQRRFAADPDIVGRSLTLDNEPYEIVGVMASRGDLDPDLWVPIDLPAETQRVGRHAMLVIARLRPGVSVLQAQSALDVVARRLEKEYPGFNVGHGARVEPMHEALVGDTRRPLAIVLGAVGFVLLIACANVAHLLLTRAAARQKELAIRTALGAARGRLIRQLLTESLLLSAIGGALGLLLAAWIVDLLPAIEAISMPRLDGMTIDRRVLAVTVGLTVLTGILSGIAPALRGSGPGLAPWLSAGGRESRAPGGRVGGVLIVSEVALVVVLLTGAGLMIRSFVRLMRVDPGFNAAGVLTIPLSLTGPRYERPGSRAATFETLVDRIRTVPGVLSVGATDQSPLTGGDNTILLAIEGRPDPPPSMERRVSLRSVTADYFRALEIPLRRGRFFSAADARLSTPLIRWWAQQPYPLRFSESQAPPVALINDTLARLYFPGEDPIGQRIRLIFSPPVTIVGIVGSVRHGGLSVAPPPELYLSHLQEPQGGMTIVARTAGDPTLVSGMVREQIRGVDPNLPIGQIRTMNDVVGHSVGRPRFDALLLGAFGALAILLSIIGIYGVMSYSVRQRTHEIGIRATLGARRRDVLTLVLGRALLLSMAGVAVGVGGALALTGTLRNLLYEVEPTDLPTFATVAIVAMGIALLASYLPAQRALNVDPLQALRAE